MRPLEVPSPRCSRGWRSMLAALRLSGAARRGFPALESCCRAAASSRALAAGRTKPPEPRDLPRTIPPLPPIPDPPEGSMLRRLSRKEVRRSINPSGKVSSRQLVQARSFLGFNRRATHPSSFHYLLGRMGGGHAIIDPDETLWAMRKVMAFLKKVAFRGGRILFVSTDPTLARLTRVVGEQTGQFYLAKRWVPGMLTNWQKARAHVQNKLSPTPDGKGRIKNIDVVKANAFVGVEGMSAPPAVVVVLDGTQLLNEAAKLNIPVVAVTDTDMQSDKHVDYAIPANSKSLRFQHTLAQMLVRSINEGRALRDDLEGFALKRPPPAEGDWDEGWSGGGGGARWQGGGRR